MSVLIYVLVVIAITAVLDGILAIRRAAARQAEPYQPRHRT